MKDYELTEKTAEQRQNLSATVITPPNSNLFRLLNSKSLGLSKINTVEPGKSKGIGSSKLKPIGLPKYHNIGESDPQRSLSPDP